MDDPVIENIVEGIKLVGGIAGLVTAAFTIWDRAHRTRPQVSVIADPIFGSGQRYLYVVVSNPSRFEIRVTTISVTPKLYEVWNDDGVDASIDAENGIKASAFFVAGDEKRFPIFLPVVEGENQDIRCKINVQWRCMRHEHIPRVPVCLRRSPRTLEAQRDDKA